MDKVQLIVYTLLVLGTGAEKLRFDDFKLYKLKVANERQLLELQMMEDGRKGVKY